ncbi:MAG: hypothetical protein Q7T01_04780 [bacterium]|nr:hypothetical protein [bacterium]
MSKVRVKSKQHDLKNDPVSIGAGIAALSVATYFLFGPGGKRHRHDLRGLAVQVKKEMVKKFKQSQDVAEPMYRRIVQEVSVELAKKEAVNKEALQAMVEDMQRHWEEIERDATPRRMVRRAAGRARGTGATVRRSKKQ